MGRTMVFSCARPTKSTPSLRRPGAWNLYRSNTRLSG